MNKAKLRIMIPWFFNGICVEARGLHEHFKIKEIIKAFKCKNRYNKLITKCFCPKCDNELCGSNSYQFYRVSNNGNFEYFKCSKCGTESKWDFDSICPLLIN